MVNNYLQRLFTASKAKIILLIAILYSSSSLHAQTRKPASPASPDTFKIANKLIAKKKFRKANKLMAQYRKTHPADVNALWLQAQAYLWLTNNNRSRSYYTSALNLQPENDYLRLNYIHGLLDMGMFNSADTMLTGMERNKQYPDLLLLRARQQYYMGDFKAAAAYVKEAIDLDGNNTEARTLSDEIAIARAPLLSINTSYMADNQPLNAVISSIKLENYFSRLLTLSISADEYHFVQAKADAPWVKIGDKLYFPNAGIRINADAGAVQFPVKHTMQATGDIDINKKISPQFDISVNGSYAPYFDTKTSIDTNISVARFSAMLNWHKRKWCGQAAIINSIFADNNNVYSAYAYVMAPIATFDAGQLNIGFSSSYSNSDKNTYTATKSLNDILAVYTSTYSISGIYAPYFAPTDLYVNSALLSLELKLSRKFSLNLNGDAGYGSIKNPYLYLNTDNTGKAYIAKGYQMESFTSADLTAVLNYKIDKTWQLTARYMYRNTYFFTSNYGGLGISKSFLPGRHKKVNSSSSAYSRRVKEIEDKIQALYSITDPDNLAGAVAKIETALHDLQNAQLETRNTSEILPGSDEAGSLQSRYDALNDMLHELKSISLDDYDSSIESKRQWLVEKLYELTAISYNGPLE